MRRIILFLLTAALVLISLASCEYSVCETTTATSVLETEETGITTIEEEIIATTEEEIIETTTVSETIDISLYDQNFLEELRQYLPTKMILAGYTVIDFPQGSYLDYMSYRKYDRLYRDRYSPLIFFSEKAYYKEYDRELTWEDFTSIYRGMPVMDLVELVGLPNGEIMGRPYYELSDGTYVVLHSTLELIGSYKIGANDIDSEYPIKWDVEGERIFDVMRVDQQGNVFRRGLSTLNFFDLDTIDSDEYIMIKVPTEQFNHLQATQLRDNINTPVNPRWVAPISMYATYKPIERKLTANDLMAVLERDMPADIIVSLLGEPNGLIEILNSDVISGDGEWHPYYMLDNGSYAILEIVYPEQDYNGKSQCEYDVFYELILVTQNGDVHYPFSANEKRTDGRRFLQLPNGSYAMFKKEERSLTLADFEELKLGMQTNAMFALVGNPDGYLVDTKDYVYMLDDGSFIILQMGLTKNERNESVNALTSVIHIDVNGEKTALQ